MPTSGPSERIDFWFTVENYFKYVIVQYKITLMQNRLRNYYFYSKFSNYNHQQPSLMDKYDVTFVFASRSRRLFSDEKL